MDKRMWKKILAMLLLMSCICTTLASAESLKRETVQPEATEAAPVEAVVPAVEVPVEEAVQEEVAAQEGHQWF